MALDAAGNATAAEPFDDLDERTPTELERWWLRRLRRVLGIAYDELPFYRARFDAAGFHPRELRRLEDHAHIPCFDRHDLQTARQRANVFEVGIERGGDAPGSVVAATSGTQGTTFFPLPPRWRREQGRSSLRAHWWAGLRPGMPFVLSAPAWHTYAAVQTWWAGELGLPCAMVAGTYIPRFAGRIVDAFLTFRPRFATLFLPMVFPLLAEARRRGLAACEPFASIESLIVTGAPITTGMRARLRRETGIPRVVELAGSSENLLAVECAAECGLHVVPDTCYAEVVDPTTGASVAPGARGRVRHTALIPWGAVYVHYDGGDLGELDATPCACGLPSPRIKLLGRAEDTFELGRRAWLPYDVQQAAEAEMPELAGVAFAILREGLAAGRLELLTSEAELGGHARPGVLEELERRLARRFEVTVTVRRARQLPLLFKGVPAVVERRAVA